MESSNISNNNSKTSSETILTNRGRSDSGEFGDRAIQIMPSSSRTGRCLGVMFFSKNLADYICSVIEIPQDKEEEACRPSAYVSEKLCVSTEFKSSIQYVTYFQIADLSIHKEKHPESSKNNTSRPSPAVPTIDMQAQPIIGSRLDGGLYTAAIPKESPLFLSQLPTAAISKKFQPFSSQDEEIEDIKFTANLGGFLAPDSIMNPSFLENITQRQKAFLGEIWDLFNNTSVKFMKSHLDRVYKNWSLICFPSLLSSDPSFQLSICNPSSFLNYNSDIEKIFGDFTKCFLSLLKEVDVLSKNILSNNYADLKNFSIKCLYDILIRFNNSASVMFLDMKARISPYAVNAYFAFDFLLLNWKLLFMLNTRLKPSVHIAEKIVAKKLLAQIDAYLDRFYPHAQKVFEYEKNLLPEEEKNQLVFPKKANDEWIIPPLPKPQKKPQKTTVSTPPKPDSNDNSAASKEEEIESPFIQESASNVGKKKGGKPQKTESSKKEEILEKVEEVRKLKSEKAEAKMANRLSRSNVLTAEEWDAVYKYLTDHFPKSKNLFDYLFSNHNPLQNIIPDHIETLANKMSTAIKKVFPGDEAKNSLAHELERSIKVHAHPPHNSTDTGKILQKGHLIMVRSLCFVHRGLFPRQNWLPTSEEWAHYGTFLDAMGMDDSPNKNVNEN